MTQHSRIPPSSAARWVPCPGSALLELQFVDSNSPESEEGDAAHWVCAEWLTGEQPQVGVQAPNGIVVTQEMIDNCRVYVSDIMSTVGVGKPHVEERVECPNIHSESFGTVDAFYFSGDTLYIWDFKYGHGFVEVFENWQLLNYAMGLAGTRYPARKISFTLVQPRCYHAAPVRNWRLDFPKIEPYTTQLIQSAHAALSPGAICNPGKHCRYCIARHACDALQAAVYVACDHAQQSTPRELSPAGLGLELAMLQDAAKLIEYRQTGLEAQAMSMLKGGKPVPGFGTEESKGRLNWDKPVQEVLFMGKLLGKDLSKENVITPTQAMKLGLSEDIVNRYASRKCGKKLVRDDNTKARQIFGDK